MSTLALTLLWSSFVPSALFTVTYALVQPWYRSWLGWAHVVSSASLTALIGLGLVSRLSGRPLMARNGASEGLVWGVYSFVTLGTWLMFAALLIALNRAWRRGSIRT